MIHRLLFSLATALLVMLSCAPDAAAAGLALVSPATRCLAKGDHSLEYPREEYDMHVGGRVEVELTFVAPDAPPQVRLVDWQGKEGGPFEQAVRSHVQGYRLPCMESADAPVRLRQQFDFKPDDGRVVYWSQPSDPLAQERQRQLACVTMPDRMTMIQALAMAGGSDSAVAVMRLRFTGPDEVPQVTVLEDGGSPARVRSAQKLLRNLRMPCLAGAPVEGVWVLNFIAGNEFSVLRDMGLTPFLRGVENLEERPVSLNLDAMKCPFDVRLTLMQPYAANPVGEVGTSDPSRFPLLTWLSELRLKLPRPALSKVIGQTMTISVPCGKIDL